MTSSPMCRPTLDEYYSQMLELVASRGTCCRRQVASIITDDKGHLISTGYNGVPKGMPHCIDTPCPGASEEAGSTSKCLAIHAEQNALLQAGSRLEQARRMYCTTTPCFHCAKLILCSPIKRVYCKIWYADKTGWKLLHENGVEVIVEKNV